MLPVICIMGPTASGKTELGLEVAERYNGEIVSVDSALVYRGMDIGTAKPGVPEQRGIPHHLIDICDPWETYSAAEFRSDALKLITDLHGRQKVPVLVGGTGLYFRALEQGLNTLPASEPAIREQLTLQLAQHGHEYMHMMLAKVDPQAAQRLHVNDTQRILRALEVFNISGQPMSVLWDEQQVLTTAYNYIKIAVAPAERSVLHQRIAQRFDRMLDLGLIAEVEGLRALAQIKAELPSMRSVGYRQVWQFLDGEFDAETMREKGIVATRQLAKRQFTWFRKEQNLQWFDSVSDGFLSDILSFINTRLEI
ncbi:MAG: tRNA (adenosine(37)-N6)-dimethylallyltransferase MiaA [Gammaproteobacteria bacterium]|nr:tRNA (adenosine(37)-N6)-dimethylallyltransferase MiaA [Gammaproteobacteria bacterium]